MSQALDNVDGENFDDEKTLQGIAVLRSCMFHALFGAPSDMTNDLAFMIWWAGNSAAGEVAATQSYTASA